MLTTLDLLMRIEHRLTAIEYRLRVLERKKPGFDPAKFLKGPMGKLLLIVALLAAQVPVKEALLAVLK